MAGQPLDEFLQPLALSRDTLLQLASKLASTYRRLAAESDNQFLPTPIPYSILRPSGSDTGRYLAIDIGGTNLRVGFVELSVPDERSSQAGTGVAQNESRVNRTLEKSWPIGDHLKNEKAEDLFEWIGTCIAEVVEDGLLKYGQELPPELAMGVTFSFPMIQQTISEAILMSMGKGFAITSSLDLGAQLRAGYVKATNHRELPPIKIAAIVNDAVATLVSFIFQLNKDSKRRAVMGLIVGTGNNATIPLRLDSLHPSKRTKMAQLANSNGRIPKDERMVINTEWSINGTASPLRELNLITIWDAVLDMAGETPGFMPFEYMTSGRYLGELGRLVILDYFTTQLKIPEETLPLKLLRRHGLTTSFLGNLGSHSNPFNKALAVEQLTHEFPPNSDHPDWIWDFELAEACYKIGKIIQVRAAAMTAAAIVGLLDCAGEISVDSNVTGITVNETSPLEIVEELVVGYTGGCIVHFQDYLVDCQEFLEIAIEALSSQRKLPRIVLQACNDGGIIGAAVLARAVLRRNTQDQLKLTG